MNAPFARALDESISVAAQLAPPDMARAAEAGFRSVINNRPDFEGGADQPTSEQMAEAAKAAGLSYEFLPVSPAYQSPEEIERFAQLIDTLPKPILAFCRSGARSGRLVQAARTAPRRR